MDYKILGSNCDHAQMVFHKFLLVIRQHKLALPSEQLYHQLLL